MAAAASVAPGILAAFLSAADVTARQKTEPRREITLDVTARRDASGFVTPEIRALNDSAKDLQGEIRNLSRVFRSNVRLAKAGQRPDLRVEIIAREEVKDGVIGGTVGNVFMAESAWKRRVTARLRVGDQEFPLSALSTTWSGAAEALGGQIRTFVRDNYELIIVESKSSSSGLQPR